MLQKGFAGMCHEPKGNHGSIWGISKRTSLTHFVPSPVLAPLQPSLLVFITADDAYVMILAGVGSALASIPLVTDFNVWIVWVRVRFFGRRS